MTKVRNSNANVAAALEPIGVFNAMYADSSFARSRSTLRSVVACIEMTSALHDDADERQMATSNALRPLHRPPRRTFRLTGNAKPHAPRRQRASPSCCVFISRLVVLMLVVVGLKTDELKLNEGFDCRCIAAAMANWTTTTTRVARLLRLKAAAISLLQMSRRASICPTIRRRRSLYRHLQQRAHERRRPFRPQLPLHSAHAPLIACLAAIRATLKRCTSRIATRGRRLQSAVQLDDDGDDGSRATRT